MYSYVNDTAALMQTLRGLRGKFSEGQARREVESADSQEAKPTPGFTMESMINMFYLLPNR